MKKLSGIFLSFVLLAGCGEENMQTDDATTAPNILKAYNKLASAPFDELIRVDLTDHIEGNDVALASIYAEKPENCFAQIDGKLSVNLQMAKLGRCDFTFLAKDSLGNQAEAKLVSVTSNQEDPSLPPISTHLIKSDSGTHIINLENELFPLIELEGFALDADSLTIESQENNLLNDLKVESDLQLSFSIPNYIGWHRIHYTLNNGAAKLSHIGEIFVSVADEINQAPTIKHKIYDFPTLADIDNGTYKLDIDLEKLDCDSNGQNCLIEDEQPWRLTDVSSIFNVDLSLPANPDMFNKRFSFASRSLGPHEVSYLVSDNEGASSMGVVRIHTHYHKPWDIAYSELDPTVRGVEYYFLPPLTHNEAKALLDNDNHQNEIIAGDTYLVSTWTKDDAIALCEKLSDNDENITYELPNFAAIKQIYQADDEDDVNHIFWNVIKNWPRDAPYFLSDRKDRKDQGFLIPDDKFINTTQVGVEDNALVYVTCAACVVLDEDKEHNCKF